MAPQESLLDELECGLCSDALYKPVALPCCGKLYCQTCIESWQLTRTREGIKLRCPVETCGDHLPLRRFPVVGMLQALLESQEPDEMERRRVESESDTQAIAEAAHLERAVEPYQLWMDVFATRELKSGAKTLVNQFVPGVVVGFNKEGRITVKFHTRVDSRNACVDVLPAEIRPQLPARLGLKAGDEVAAIRDLSTVVGKTIHFGTPGVVFGTVPDPVQTGEQRLDVRFEQFEEGRKAAVFVKVDEVHPRRFMGFEVAQRVRATRDLRGGEVLFVKQGTTGTVVGAYSDTRVTVRFDSREDGSMANINAMLDEVETLD
eukprot:CAMPEP_0206497102 /NCGR_PEP_ID=MMETSP0324_2-20121206/49933_1 /ASSEMBLY_ACC=CAM_ASM_000836 /TAXON_ID=2866 /ORGANISM="Crypthecodinium cohnii, Strain Seligo" /LENGTH=318 /DNA_ID=CAMNT_0053982503 /DNA_START=118 /DNA_END=1074 /DNA_ORIENTATION=-